MSPEPEMPAAMQARIALGEARHARLVRILFWGLRPKRLVTARLMPGGREVLMVDLSFLAQMLGWGVDQLRLLPGVGKKKAKELEDTFAPYRDQV